MKEFKIRLALILTASMVLNPFIPAYAGEIVELEEPVVQQEITTPANADYIELDGVSDNQDADAFEEATPANAECTDETFIRETVVDGIKITLTADPGVFPGEAELWAEQVEDEAAEEAIEEAVEKERDSNVNVVLSYKFDIKMFVNGEEVQPDTSKGSVKVTFTLEEELSECLDANAYHLKEEADGELIAENIGAEVKIAEESSESVKPAVFDEDGVLEDGVIEDDVTKKVTKLEAETDGFSYYVVEFTYNELQYVLSGDSSIKLSEILKTFAIEGTVSDAEVSNEELFTVTKDAESDDWTVAALQAFSSKEWMKVTINGQVYEIVVTDDQNGPDVPYFTWDKEQKKLVAATRSQYTEIASEEEDYTFEGGKWYVVKGTVNITNRITNNGTTSNPAHLILTDNCTFNVPAGIHNGAGKGLIIYGQTNNSGKLQIDKATENDAGIGGVNYKKGVTIEEGGTLTINGGTVNVTKKGLGAGIGGGTGGAGGTITINGGTVDATGGGDAAGIGGCSGEGGEITINGGTVNATGGSGGSGIGGGNGKAGGTITISGGKVIALASGSNGGAGIGGGNGGAGGTIEISGGEVTAIGGSGGAGIGGGNFDSKPSGSAGRTITISGGTVDAIGGGNAAGIGGGHSGSGERIIISKGTIKATGGSGGAGIGGGNGGDGGEITISGGTVTAMVGLDTSTGGAGIGGGNGGEGGKITISGGTVTALATASNGGAGIGGGNSKAGGEITISGGKVTAIASSSNAGIGNGGGYVGSGGTLSIGNTPKILFAGQNRASASTRSAADYINSRQDYPFALISYIDFQVQYKVEHYKQKEIRGEEYDLVEGDTQTYSGTPGTIATATANQYDGYSNTGIPPTPIALDGSTVVILKYDKNYYTVTFNVNGHGETPPKRYVLPGHPVEAPPEPKADGCVFDGWYKEQESTPYNFSTQVNESFTLHAKWKIVVKLDAQGGSGGTASVEVAVNSDMQQIDIPNYSGYLFGGYYTKENGNGTRYYNADGKSARTWDLDIPNTPLYAYWISNPSPTEKFIVSFDSQGGSAVAAVQVLKNHTLASPKTPERIGYDFIGWKKADGSAFGFGTEPVTANIMLTASWTAKSYEITWSVNGRISKSFCTYGSLPEYTGSTDKEGFAFTGWKPAIQIAKEPASYTAQYIEKKDTVSYTVEFDTDGAKEYIPAQRVAAGSTAAKPGVIPSKDGHTFKGWNKADRTTPFNFDTDKITADTTIYAVWEVIPKAEYMIRWVDYDDSLLKSEKLEEGSLPDYGNNNPSRSGYIFTGWTPKIALVTRDATYKATYEKKSSGGGGGSGSGGGGGSGSGGGGGSGSGGGSAGSPSKITYEEKPAVTPITVAANGAQMIGTAVVSIPAAQLAEKGAVPAAGAWNKENGMWAFTKADGNKAKNEWALITVAGGNASYFYFDSNGNMATGWQQIDGKWMYFNNESGSLLGACLVGPGRTPDGYEIDASGAWTGR